MGKIYSEINVLEASRKRIKIIFDNFERIYCSFSGGKDSTIVLHLLMEEAIKRNRKIGVLFIDLEAQYFDTIKHIRRIFSLYKNYIDIHWVCLELLLRNAVTNYEPRWVCWDETKRELWIRAKPIRYKNNYPFFIPKMEFEEFMVLFGQWYGKGELTADFVGIRVNESLDRYRTIKYKKETFGNNRWTTKVIDRYYNVYPIYDWKTEDIWRYHSVYLEKPYNKIYDKMQMAGVKLSQQRLCQPFGDDQRRGLWLYHILEPQTWFKLIARVNGANSGAMYIQEKGNMTGYHDITKPDNHTWESFCNLLLQTMPKNTRDHYIFRFKKFISGWHKRGYIEIPEESPIELENKCWAPSWRKMCKVLLRNDYWCKGLGQSQPKSIAYGKYLIIKKNRIEREKKLKEEVRLKRIEKEQNRKILKMVFNLHKR